MPVQDDQLGYPICDTDLWIKVCVIDNIDIIFQRYRKIFISDAVNVEIRNKATDDPQRFSCALDKFKECYNTTMKCLVLKNDTFFNESERDFVLKKFKEHRIPYDISRKEFIGRPKDLGEKVTVIYAAVLNLSVILSEDGGCWDFVIKNYPTIAVENLKQLMNFYGYTRVEISKLNEQLRQKLANLSSSNSNEFTKIKEILKKAT